MSVFIRKDSKDGIYSYDFQLGGRRFSGSTGKTAKREAREVEKRLRDEARALLTAERSVYAPELTIRAACARYWQEVGQHHANARTTMWSLTWLEQHFGPETMLHDIDSGRVASMVARRRGELVPSQRKPDRKYATPEIRKRISPATVNRTVTQPLREILLRARDVWEVRTAKVDWSEHLLSEPRERVREARIDEEAAIMGELDRGYDVAVSFAFLTGCRRMEIVGLVWSRVDFFNRQFTVIGKGNKARTIPMSTAVFDMLWSQQGYHADSVFTFEAKRTLKLGDRRFERGRRYPVTDAGLRTALRRAVSGAGVADFRFHDTRHTAATRVLRKSNLRVVQELLGHEDIKVTAKYAHALKEDVRAALDAIATPSPTESPTDTAARKAKSLKRFGKAG